MQRAFQPHILKQIGDKLTNIVKSGLTPDEIHRKIVRCLSRKRTDSNLDYDSVFSALTEVYHNLGIYDAHHLSVISKLCRRKSLFGQSPLNNPNVIHYGQRYWTQLLKFTTNGLDFIQKHVTNQRVNVLPSTLAKRELRRVCNNNMARVKREYRLMRVEFKLKLSYNILLEKEIEERENFLES